MGYPDLLNGIKNIMTQSQYNCSIHLIMICGITISEYAMIGSGAVVTKDVPLYLLIVGNPGRIICEVDKKGNQIQ